MQDGSSHTVFQIRGAHKYTLCSYTLSRKDGLPARSISMRESTMREQELEVVKTAYFWENQIVHQTQELQRVNGDKPARPAQPREPHLEKHSAQKIPYPEIKPMVDLPKPVRWKLSTLPSAAF